MEFVTTADGSKTLFNAEVGEHYHSKHGAQQESVHVFLNTGLKHFLERDAQKDASILEIGFGTGLNFLMTADYCLKEQIGLHYMGIEAYPLAKEVIEQTGYDAYVSREIWLEFVYKYPIALQEQVKFNRQMGWGIANKKVMDFQTTDRYDVIYFDAFAEVHQPEMWTPETLAHVCSFLKPGGVFVTYAITGNLKRTMKALGFRIEKAPGAPGKREMLRATKL